MEEPGKGCHKPDKHKKMVINIGKGGGGVGGVILLGGVLATAAVASAAFTLKRRHQKSSSNKNNRYHQNPSTLSNEIEDDSNNDEATKGLQILVSDFSPEGHHHLSNGKTRTAMSRTNLTCLMTDESLILDYKKMVSCADGGNEGPISMDDSTIKKEEFSSPTIDKLLHFEPYSVEKNMPQIEILDIKHHDDAAEANLIGRVITEGNRNLGAHYATEGTLVDQAKKGDNPDMGARSEQEQVKEDQGYDREINDVICEEVKIATGDCIVQKIHMDEKHETPDILTKEIITIGCLIQESNEVDGKELLIPVAVLQSQCQDMHLYSETCQGLSVHTLVDEKILMEECDEAAEIKQDNTKIALNEQNVENYDHLDEEILTEKCHKAGEVRHDHTEIARIEQKVDNYDESDREITTENCDEASETKQDCAYFALNEQKVENSNQHDEEILIERCDETGETKQDNAEAGENEQKVENSNQLDEEIVVEECDSEGGKKQEYQIALVSKEAENTFFNQPLRESHQDGDTGSRAPSSMEVHLEHAGLIYISSEMNQQLVDHVEAIEEDVANESLSREGMIEDEGYPTIQLIEKQQCAADSEEDIVGEMTESPEIISADIFRAENNRIVRMSYEAEDAKDNEIDDNDDDYNDGIMAEADPTAETSDEDDNEIDNYDDDDDDDVVTAEGDLVTLMSDEEESGKDSETDDYDDEEDNEEEEDHEGNCVEIVEASSEGTGDSSLESSAEAIWPTETIQELSMVLEAVKPPGQKERSNIKEEETAEADDKASSKQKNDRNGKLMSISVGEGMTEFVSQHDQILMSTKWRIFIGTGIAILWLLCFRYFLAYPS